MLTKAPHAFASLLGFFWSYFMAESQKRKERVSSNSSIESRDSETSSPADKKKRSEFSEDGDVGEALNMSVSENIQHILERLGKLDTLETLLTKSLAKLEKLETRVNDLDLKVETLEVKCRGHDKSLGEVKASAEFINQQFEQNKILFNAKTLEDFKKQESKIHQISKELLYVEAYSRRENLIITGIPEVQDATEDTLQVLQDFMANELNVTDAANIDFQRVHRLGKPSHKGPRAIIARFLKYPDKERILSLGKHLRDKDFSMFNDYPEEIQRSRKRQLKKLKDAKQAGKRASFSKSRPDMLYIDGMFVPE